MVEALKLWVDEWKLVGGVDVLWDEDENGRFVRISTDLVVISVGLVRNKWLVWADLGLGASPDVGDNYFGKLDDALDFASEWLRRG